MGMAPLAIYLAEAGVEVTGWDDGLRPEVASLLEQHGVALCPDLPEQPGLVARSSAIGPAHPLYRCAIDRGARVLRRGELLAEIVADCRLVAVVGSHGKTTTTGLLIHLLCQAGFDFGYLLGGLFRGNHYPPARFAPQSDWVVAEIDESDGTVEGFSPEITVAVNFDWDHADRYRSEADLQAAFQRLFQRTTRRVIVPHGSELLARLVDEEKRLRCAVEQDFNQANTALAIAAAGQMGANLGPGDAVDFPGIQRRQDLLAQVNGVSLLADYAHHPTEISALLDHARRAYPGKQIVVFQPHRYTRTRQFATAFATALCAADAVMLLPVYAASETPLDDGGSAAIVRASGEDWPLVEFREIPPLLDRAIGRAPPTTVLFIGAGDIDRLARQFARDWLLVESWRERLSPATKLTLGEPLASKTTLRVGGEARLYAEPANVGDLRYLLNGAKEHQLPWFILGRGSNLIVSENGFAGIVLHLRSEAFRGFEVLDGGRIRVGAGLALKRLCGLAAKQGLGGFEFLEGVPGTVGGALRMNAGAMGGWIFDIVESLELMTPDGEVRSLDRAEFHIGYRRCQELVDALALSAVLRSETQRESVAIRRTLEAYADRRKESQPREPSAGCIFKNPEGDHAGRIIDQLGLKGERIGGAQVSTVHGNFIVNVGGATSADVLELIRMIRRRVRHERGIELEPEALLVGENWEEVW